MLESEFNSIQEFLKKGRRYFTVKDLQEVFGCNKNYASAIMRDITKDSACLIARTKCTCAEFIKWYMRPIDEHCIKAMRLIKEMGGQV